MWGVADCNKMTGILDPTLCRARQRRLRASLESRRLDTAVVTAGPHVYWLTGHWPFWLHEAAAVLTADGRPHLNPKWDDVLEVRDVFTAEPGLYGPEIDGGIRLENQYLVTEAGVANLTPFPMDLA